jgi:hypothetical protein
LTTDSDNQSELAFLNVKFGLWTLLVFLTLGLVLEGLHGFKVAWYLEFETRRLMWSLAHAHGVLLAVLVIGNGIMLAVWPQSPAPWHRVASACLMASAILLPGGFLLGGAFVHGGDPGIGVLLSPVGGTLLFLGVGLTASKLKAPTTTNDSGEGQSR